MSLRTETTVRIARPPAVVFAFISDPQNLHRWDPAIRSVRLTEPGPVRKNSHLVIVAEEGGRPVSIDSHVTDFEPDRLFGVAATFSGVPLRLRWQVEPDGNATKLTARGEADVGGLLALAGGVIKGMVEDRLTRAHANLKQILEAPG
jgi:carbon monoxide dehydrogenase subunit G